MALCLKHTVSTLFHPGNILYQTMIVNSDVLLVPNILDALAIFRNWRSHLTSLPRCKLIRTFREYGVILPFSGITLQQNILKISDLLPDQWWMDKRQYNAPCNSCLN
jgi:hypothetical protein